MLELELSIIGVKIKLSFIYVLFYVFSMKFEYKCSIELNKEINSPNPTRIIEFHMSKLFLF